MLCFLPTLPPLLPRRDLPPRPLPCSRGMATLLSVACAGLALLTPVGWVRSQPVYTGRVGQVLRLGPRAEDGRLVAQHGGRHPRFFVSPGAGFAMPPGLVMDDATGALVGTPSMPGTYTLAVAVADDASPAVVGASFKVRVLPP